MRSQHRLYRDAQNDYWEARARRARRILAFRRFIRVAAAVVIAVMIIAVAGYAAHRADPRLAIPGFAASGDGNSPAVGFTDSMAVAAIAAAVLLAAAFASARRGYPRLVTVVLAVVALTCASRVIIPLAESTVNRAIDMVAPQHDYNDPAQLADAVAKQENMPNVSCSAVMPPLYMCVGFTNDDSTTAGWDVIVSNDGHSFHLAAQTSTQNG